MAKFTFFNIAKANAEIEAAANVLTPALEKAGIKTLTVAGKEVPCAAAPLADKITALIVAHGSAGEESPALAEALASNEEISTQLSQANTDLAGVRSQLETVQGEVNTLGGQLKAACAAMGLKPKEGATSAEMISAMQTSVASTLARLQVPAAAIPAGAPVQAGGGAAAAQLTGRARMLRDMTWPGKTN